MLLKSALTISAICAFLLKTASGRCAFKKNFDRFWGHEKFKFLLDFRKLSVIQVANHSYPHCYYGPAIPTFI